MTCNRPENRNYEKKLQEKGKTEEKRRKDFVIFFKEEKRRIIAISKGHI